MAMITTQAAEISETSASTRGRLLIASCRSGARFADQVASSCYGILQGAGAATEMAYLEGIDFEFSDSETCVRLESEVEGYDVFMFQALYDPTSSRCVDQNYMAFLIAARTLREWGAKHVTGVLPYIAYARQNRSTPTKREPATARLMADLAVESGVDRIVIFHPHTAQISDFYRAIRADTLKPTDLFVEAFSEFRDRQDVILVAPDAGACNFARDVSQALNLECALTSKYHPRREETAITEIVGDLGRKRIAVILDDMISSGGTMFNLTRKLVEEKGVEEIYIGISHNLCQDVACERLEELYANYHLKRVLVTNSIPQTRTFLTLPFVEQIDLSYLFARTIMGIHFNRSCADSVFPGSSSNPDGANRTNRY